jgi:hypothetical protein
MPKALASHAAHPIRARTTRHRSCPILGVSGSATVVVASGGDPDMSRSEIPIRSLSRWPGVDINRVQVERARRLVLSAIFSNADVTRRDFGPACFGPVVSAQIATADPRLPAEQSGAGDEPA